MGFKESPGLNPRNSKGVPEGEKFPASVLCRVSGIRRLNGLAVWATSPFAPPPQRAKQKLTQDINVHSPFDYSKRLDYAVARQIPLAIPGFSPQSAHFCVAYPCEAESPVYRFSEQSVAKRRGAQNHFKTAKNHIKTVKITKKAAKSTI